MPVLLHTSIRLYRKYFEMPFRYQSNTDRPRWISDNDYCIARFALLPIFVQIQGMNVETHIYAAT